MRMSQSLSCWDVSEGGPRAKIDTYPCHSQGGNQYWKLDLVIKRHNRITIVYEMYFLSISHPDPLQKEHFLGMEEM